MQHRYLFILEVAPIKVSETYVELPSHLTLMSRFFSKLSPTQLDAHIRPIFEQQRPIRVLFEGMVELGPKRLPVHLVKHTHELRALHNKLHGALDAINVAYEYPQFIGENHKPHVTQRVGISFHAGDTKTMHAAYLIEVVDGTRVVRSSYAMSDR